MGIATIEALQAGLLQGLAGTTPVAVVQHASLPQQRQACCTLAELAATVARECLGSPAIIVVGDVAAAALALDGEQRAAAEFSSAASSYAGTA